MIKMHQMEGYGGAGESSADKEAPLLQAQAGIPKLQMPPSVGFIFKSTYSSMLLACLKDRTKRKQSDQTE